jgi:DNA-directed RNA polymerase specialized sigma24 family protein
MSPENHEPSESPESSPSDGGAFPATAWSMLHQVQGATDGESLAGWERLARAYWQPLYAFIRRRGADHHSAADDVQGFFVHMLSRDFFQRIERGDGLFRTFLLTTLQHWRIDQHRATTAQKRGHGIAPLSLAELEAAGAMPVAMNGSKPVDAKRSSSRSAASSPDTTLLGIRRSPPLSV